MLEFSLGMSDQAPPGQGGLLAALPPLDLVSPPPSPDIFHTPSALPAESGADVLQFGHYLNLEKQRAKILDNIDAPDVQFELKDLGKCVNAKFSPGFYAKVAKPIFYGRTKGSSFQHPSTSFLITEYVPQQDAAGLDQSLLLKLAFTAQGVECSMTIHVYNSSQSLLLQGDRIMPDGNTVAIWFVKHILADYFAAMAKTQHADISAFHDALLTLASTPSTATSKSGKGRKASSSAPRPYCQLCSKQIIGRGKITPCSAGQCTGWMHSLCETKHKCTSPCSRKRRPDDVSFFTFDQDEIAEAESYQPVVSLTPPFTCAAITSLPVTTSVDTPIYSSSLPVTSCQVATSCITTENLITTRQMAMPYTTTISAFTTLPSITFTSAAPILATSAAPPLPQTSVRPKTASKPPPKKARNGVATTPHEIEVEFLTRELSFAKTKITSLEASLKDRDDRIDILKERMLSMEDPINASLRSRYLNPVPAPQTQGTAPQVQGVSPLVQAAAPHAQVAAPPAQAAASQGLPLPANCVAPLNLQQPPPPLSHPQPIIEVMAELSLLRQQVSTLQNTVSNIMQPGFSNTAIPSALSVPVSSAAPMTTPQTSHSSVAGKRVGHKTAAAQVSKQSGNLPVYGAGCWINGIPNGKTVSRDAPRRILIGPPPPNVAPWSWLPTAARKNFAKPANPSSSAQPESKGNQLSRSAGSFRAAQHVKISQPVSTAQPKKHLWTNKGIKLGGPTISHDDQQTARLRDQRLAAIAFRNQPPAATSTLPASSSAPPPLSTSSAPPLSSTSSLTAVPAIPVQNRFDVFSGEGNE